MTRHDPGKPRTAWSACYIRTMGSAAFYVLGHAIVAVLYLLLPESVGTGYLAFLGAYLASVLAGVLSHVPAGLGVLESMLLLLLPDVPPEQLLAAVLMYRVIYEIVPVLCSLALWFVFEGFSRDGALLRAMGRQAPIDRPESPTIDRSE